MHRSSRSSPPVLVEIYSEKISGSKHDRPELDRMIGQLRNGDVVIITKYDRLAKHVLPDIASKVKDVEA